MALPDSLQALFNEHEQIHAAELAAAEHVIEQTNRSLRAADALIVTLRTENVGLGSALAVQIELADKWEISSNAFETALNGKGFLLNLVGDLPKIAGYVGIGFVLASL